MDTREDYIHFLIENKDIIGELKEHKTTTYELLNPVFSVLDFINEVDFEIEGEDPKDIIDIFQIGFTYLYSSIDHVKRILNENFDDDFEEFLPYDKNMYLYIKTDEIDTMYQEQNGLISNMLDQLGSMFEYRKKADDKIVEQVEKELEKALQDLGDEKTTNEIFEDIAEELGLEIF